VDFDLLIRGGRVVEGSRGAEAVRADVGVTRDRIVAVGPLPDARAATVISADGRIVAPGFIDPHVHSETALRGTDDRWGALLQGITTHLTGADGFGWAGLSEDDAASLWRSTTFAYGDPSARPNWPTPGSYLESFGSVPVNVAAMAPHQAIRFGVLSWQTRQASAHEMEAMRRATRDWLDAGALGLATGLDYQPAASASNDEVVALCEEVVKVGGVYAPHQRYNELGRAKAYFESFEIARRSGVRLAIAHEFVDDESGPLLDEALADVDVSIDWYVYPAGATHLLSMLPVADQAGGPDALRERLVSPAYRTHVIQVFQESLEEASRKGDREYFSATRSGRHIGRSIAEIAADEGRSLGATAVDLLLDEMPDAVLVYMRGTSPEAFDAIVRRTLAWRNFMVASDGLYHGPLPHPRGFGCFARILGHYVRDEAAIGLGDAVYRMSGFAAERYGLRDRGRIAPGFGADLVVFDPETVDGPASWAEPRRAPTGIDAVILNGTVAVERGVPNGKLAGRVLRRQDPGPG
jgi:N-acyl-D-amino-acid deacylase